MSDNNTNDDGLAGVAAAGVEAAKDVVGRAAKVMDEILAGLEKVAHHGNSIAGSGVKVVSGAVKGPSGSSDTTQTAGGQGGGQSAGQNAGQHSIVDSQVVSQLFDLAQQVLKVAGDAASRVLQSGLGPVERMLDADSHRHDDIRVELGKVRAGARRSVTFVLENDAAQPTTVTLELRNPLASMKDTIATQFVHLSPAPVPLPPSTADGPGCAEVTVEVEVPATAQAGYYLGIIRSAEVSDLSVVLGVDVA